MIEVRFMISPRVARAVIASLDDAADEFEHRQYMHPRQSRGGVGYSTTETNESVAHFSRLMRELDRAIRRHDGVPLRSRRPATVAAGPSSTT